MAKGARPTASEAARARAFDTRVLAARARVHERTVRNVKAGDTTHRAHLLLILAAIDELEAEARKRSARVQVDA